MSVNSFYIDETEVANVHYREYLYWLSHTFDNDTAVMSMALPDTLVWRSELAYNEPYVEYYFRYPAYNYYPVVGVSWQQAHDFCIWRSDRVNEKILIDKELIYKAHHWLILHGRYVCVARNPKCGECGLKPVCKYYQSIIKKNKPGF